MFNFLAGFRFPHDVIDILVVAYVIYRILLLIKGTRAFQILLGLILILGAFIASQRLELVTLNTILNAFFSSLILVVVVLFQNDIRRALAQMGMSSFMRPTTDGGGATTDRVEELAKATVSLANKKIGSITVLERQTRLRSHIETGSFVDGVLSSELLQSIFLPYSPIHDGAVIVAEERIIWAGCFLPLTTRVDLEQELGTRHRAAMGITEETDAVAIVVSEETGRISVVVNGRITRDLDGKTLRKVLYGLLYGTGYTTKGKKKKKARSKEDKTA